MPKPKLTFFCELPTQELKKLFDGRFVIDDLKDLNASLSLGIIDLSDDRAVVVKRLNEAGVPVIAWLLLPEEEGYWFNIDNFKEATARYVAFKAWSSKHNLQWDAIGLDIEINLNELRLIMEDKPDQDFIKTLFKRFFDKQRVLRSQRTYQALVDLIRADGYRVESYHLPVIIEERRAKGTILQRLTGLVDLETDLEVLMLYSSFLRPNGAAVLWSYAPDADSVGVGSTGGGVEVEGVNDIEPLTWEEFSRDLRLCVMREKPIHVFSLEGCARQGFLSKLSSFNWDQPVTVPAEVARVNLFRTLLATLLWILERPWVILVGLATLIGLGFLIKHKQKK